MTHLLARADCRRGIPLADGSVHCVITSPPFFGLRDYQTARWEGGDPGCDHVERRKGNIRGGLAALSNALDGCNRKQENRSDNDNSFRGEQYRDACGKCGARRVDAQIGLEPTVEAYVARMVAVFRDVRRVLHDSGCVFLNLGDSYSSGGRSTQCEPSAGDGRRGMMNGRATRPPPSDGVKPKDLLLVPQRVAIALQSDGWTIRSQIPWVKRCLSGGTWLYARTQKGDMPVMLKDLVRLRPETVQLWDGQKWNRVVGFHETRPDEGRAKEARKYARDLRRGQPSLFAPQYLEIELRSGERIGCTADHRWPTARGLVHAGDLVLGDVIDSAPIPEPDPPSTPGRLPDDAIGWFVGLYLAEGYIDNDVICLCGHVNETESRLARLRSLVSDYDGRLWVGKPLGNGQRINLTGPVLLGILKAYVSGDSSKTKCLTRAAWRRSNGFLSAFLAGYLEGDGHWEEQAQRWRFGFTNNDGLARDLRAIGARIGVQVRLRRGRVAAEKGGVLHKVWRGEARYSSQPSDIPGTFPRRPNAEIVAIRQSRARVYYDIEVENEPHLFALASGVLTHNSSMPESVDDRPSSSVEYVFLMTKKSTYFYDADAVRSPLSVVSREQVAQFEATGVRPGLRVKAEVPGQAIHKGGLCGVGGGSRGGAMNPAGRNRRNGDWWFESVGMLLNEVGDPLGLDVNPQGWPGSHFATWPSKLVEPMVRAGTSERGCCPRPGCGAPWVRETERGELRPPASRPDAMQCTGNGETTRHQKGAAKACWSRDSTLLGWRPSCSCPPHDPIPCTILDIFNGSGTTGVVALAHGRRYVGLDLSPEYLAMARMRIERPHARMRPARDGSPLPLFDSIPGDEHEEGIG